MYINSSGRKDKTDLNVHKCCVIIYIGESHDLEVFNPQLPNTT